MITLTDEEKIRIIKDYIHVRKAYYLDKLLEKDQEHKKNYFQARLDMLLSVIDVLEREQSE